MNRQIVCNNNSGMSITFGSRFSPYVLIDCDGLYEISNNVTMSDNTMIDGATYQGMVIEKRNIVLTVAEKSDHQANRYQLYNLFRPKTKGTLTYIENATKRQIDYYVESINITSQTKCRTATISLLCPEPFFEDTNDIQLVMAGWSPMFEFPHEFKLEGFGERIQERIKTIDNDSGADGIGLTFIIETEGNVINPSIVHYETEEHIQVGTENNSFTLGRGEKLTITTGTNNKKVIYQHNGISEEINSYLDESSEFILLNSGINTFGYNADSGVANMIVTIQYRIKYLGV